uniref:uncharacterized protein LOC127062252 isoform X6 n=1 Tax=Vespula vulgaris TaxID=7454 RepID=UPI00223A962D|nr:uncharacterized protein LOC127062252 isoform X6 [Vespula vulgaris]
MAIVVGDFVLSRKAQYRIDDDSRELRSHSIGRCCVAPVPSVAELLVLAHDSTALYGKVNLTKFFEGHSRSNHPALRDLSYLSEEYDGVEGPKDFQELDRRNRNSEPEYLCKTKERLVELRDATYDYQPFRYYEVYCKDDQFFDRAEERTRGSSSAQVERILPSYSFPRSTKYH